MGKEKEGEMKRTESLKLINEYANMKSKYMLLCRHASKLVKAITKANIDIDLSDCIDNVKQSLKASEKVL